MSKLNLDLSYNSGQKARNNVTVPFWDSLISWLFEVLKY